MPTLYIDNDNHIELNNLTLQASGASSTGATVTATVKNGSQVVSGASDITLSATSGGSNDYRGVLGSTVTLPNNSRLQVEITAVSSSGADGKWVIEANTRKRTV